MIQLPQSVNIYFYSVNDGEPYKFLTAFDEHAYVRDNRREFNGKDAIANWSKTEIFDVKVQYEITNAWEQDDHYFVTASVDGEFDKTNLPDPFLMKHKFKLINGQIKELYVTFA
ncbi:hypothetical protein FHS16_005964 [Paenibacillus endophyticus]|uniref:Nuclear transport factor 2 family protein n=1 Tax=Paenibacillus endophyticus TaxID=1294268 RepID=A0A7W5CDT9_9BACL|nr:nuclear transport factor 2 family protein [Paenibacillus endophyticus]MBB3155848.1 hypothetical protein [Paenibacillus endophyticus]